MPTPQDTPNFKDVKPIEREFDNFARGLNTLVNPAKIRDDELSVATNIILVDEGSPARRWGTANFGNDSAGGNSHGLFPYYKSDGSKELIKVEGGYAKKYDSNSGDWDLISGASFASGQRISGILAFDTLYMMNGVDPLTKYDGSALEVFSEISAPTTNSVARGASLVSGQHLYSYRVSAENDVGETLAAAAATVAVNRERNIWNTDPTNLNDNYSTTITWESVTGATGYNIYGVNGGDETYLAHVDGENVTEWVDYGTDAPSNFFTLPLGNTTGGVPGKFIIEFKSSLLITGDPDNPSRVYFSAGVDKIDSFLISDGGGYVDISKNSDDGIATGLATYQNKAIISKERSMWELDFTESSIPSVINIIDDVGCVSHFTIKNVENDLFFLGRKIGGGAAIYVLGNEPNFLNVLRTNELSARVRPELQAIPVSSLEMAVAAYYNGWYMIFYPEGGSAINDTVLVYDRERLGFTKWNNVYGELVTVFYDADGQEYLLAADNNDGRITEIAEEYTTDKGSAILWVIRTKVSDLKAPFLYKKYKWVNMRLRNVGGTVRIKIITDGTKTAYTTSISSEGRRTAYRNFGYRIPVYRQGGELTEAQTQSAQKIVRIPISRKGTAAIARSLAVEIYGEDINSKATLLDVVIEARPKSKNFYPRSEVITG